MANNVEVNSQQYREFYIGETLGGLNEIEKRHAPKVCYYAGDISLLSKKGSRVSIVGSRKPSLNGEKRARTVTRILVEQGITIVSGMAEGIDTIAHTTALQQGGKTIAVLGTPLDNPYPKSNTRLFQDLISSQLVISQFPVGYPARPKNFPIRNRTMALISHATIIIEASEKSGTIHQGWEALRLGRPLYLMESLTKDTTLSWPAEFIKYGARILTKDNIDDIAFDLPSGEINEDMYAELFA